VKHFPAHRYAPNLHGIQAELTQTPCHPVATVVLPRTRALLIAAIIAAASFFLGAYAFGSALVAAHHQSISE
jgi:hypothetical protein